jgi:hypothetical protein
VKGLRIVLFLVATLALWYLGNFALRATWVAFDLGPSPALVRALNLALLPLSAVATWLLLRRVPEGAGGRGGGDR